MRTTYVLDTSAIIHNPHVIKNFAHSDVIIPMAVLHELDKLKKQPGQVGRSARIAIKFMDEITNLGNPAEGVLIDNDISVRVDCTYYNLNSPTLLGLGDPTYGDTQILACSIINWMEHPTKDVTLISNDINLRVKAKSRNINAEALDSDKCTLDDLYSGFTTIYNEEAGLSLQQQSTLDPTVYDLQLYPNQCILFKNAEDDGIAMGRQVGQDKIKLIKKYHPWNITPRNKEQSFAMDLIMDKNVDLVTLIGIAGTGKSLIALACAIELVISRKEYSKLIIYRPIQAVGNDIGYLPGTMEEKLGPWFQAILDNMETLFTYKNGDNWKRELEMYQKKGLIEMEAVTYIRGRSIANSIILIDECQNLTPEEVKTILTRAGENTKVILTGDIEQIDNSILDATSNGLTHVIEKFKTSELAGHITLVQGERSRLASQAAEVL